MTIEQKAKRYDKVVNEIKNLRDILLKEGVINENGVICDDFNRIFPELKGDKDEWIRKCITDLVKENDWANIYGIAKEECLAWLEKQQYEQNNNEDINILQRFSFYSYKDEPNILYLSGIYVNEDCRNKGVGTKILKVADEVAASIKCNSIRLKTEKGSHAEKLYRENGYTTILKEEGNQIWLEKQDEDRITCGNALLSTEYETN